MKASELIKELKKQIEEHGDKEVRCFESDGYGSTAVDGVSWNVAEDADDVIVLIPDVDFEQESK